ncbi:restriction endonuclease subunit S [Candidatus Deianiraea vastatrix]|uniref:Type I restriction enzyme protein n=1 Tax=Candidatus Deianiraea vastatrix TaxID=2163644 RepID=A0A5B8XGI6_9RICK|nr:restriction endonuclease subunit S [Candidatus Deianiraea vastatrix]QED23037.1 Putative type I restriction enzyme protein [Candidatus Deianiraea vastatrix]
MDILSWLSKLGFKIQSGKKDCYSKIINGYELSVDLETSKINYGKDITIHRTTTSNLSQDENLVVLDCVCRLLKKGYSPKDIELEKSWNLGHKGKGFLDILVKDKQGNSLFMIECKTWGPEFNKEKNKMFKDGGQLLSYFRQDKKPKALCLYASRVGESAIEFVSDIINTKGLNGENEEEIFISWDRTFQTIGIFENDVKCYDFQDLFLTYRDLKDLDKEHGKRIFNKFAEILRRHNISNKPKAFDIIFNFFICKIYDENINCNEGDELQFQYKRNEKNEELIDKLKKLYSGGLEVYIDILIPYIQKQALEEGKLSPDLVNQILYYSESGAFSFKKVYNKETFEDNIEIVKEVVTLLEKYKFRYDKKQQFLGDFFELLLNTGFKQESGQFFTPIPIARFICKSLPIKQITDRIIADRENTFLPYIIDYSSGAGHFITEIMDEIDIHVKSNILEGDIKNAMAKKAFIKNRDDLSWAKDYVYAIEKDERLVTISKVSSFLHGDGDANVIYGDGLAPFCSKRYKEKLLSDKVDNNNFDILIANPPYSVSGFTRDLLKEYEKLSLNPENYFELYQYLTPQSSEIECLFIERTKQLLKEGGVAGVILPISILTNGGIYEKTREIIFKNFTFKAIVSLGSNAFMATGTKTIIAFLQKRNPSDYQGIEKEVDKFLEGGFVDVAVGGIKDAFSTYASRVYEMDFETYKQILNAQNTSHELSKEYKDLDQKHIRELEKQKLIYFILTYSQKIVLGDSGEKDIEKEFYGFEFSNRRGHEGIHIYKDEEGYLQSKLYNENDLCDAEKLNTYILKSFTNDAKLESKITEIQASEDHPLKDHIHYLRLSNLMTFDLKRFDKSVNLNKRNNLKIETKFRLIKLGDVSQGIISGSTPSKQVREYWDSKDVNWCTVDDFTSFYIHDTKQHVSTKGLAKLTIIPINSVLLSCTATIGKVAINKIELTTNQQINGIVCNANIKPEYLAYFLESNARLLSAITDNVGVKHINLQMLRDFKIPFPPLDIQQKIVAEIAEIEKKEEKVREKIEKNQEKINGLFGSAKNIKDITISEIAKNLTAGGDVPKGNFSKNKTEKYQIPIYANGYQNKGLYGYTDIIKINEACVTIAARGTIGYTEVRTEPFYPIVRLICLVPKEEIANVFYIKYLLSRTQFINSGTTTPQLTVPQISGIKLSLPPLAEQQKIIAQIEPLEVEIEEAKTFLANVKEQKQAVLDKYLK